MTLLTIADPAVLLQLLLQVSRNYYSSSAQFFADADLIVQAAEAYHTPGHGRGANYRIIQLARDTVRRGRTALEAPEEAANLTYWDARIQVCVCVW
jgi:hypothetical protein